MRRSGRRHDTRIRERGPKPDRACHPTPKLHRLPGRVVNAGSVGLPYLGEPVGAFWALLGPGGVGLRRSDYDLRGAVEACRAMGYPAARP